MLLKPLFQFARPKNVIKGETMFDGEEMSILTALENDQLVRSINADEEIALAKQVAEEYLSQHV